MGSTLVNTGENPLPHLSHLTCTHRLFRHDLCGLKELTSTPAVWKALVDTLVLQGPSLAPRRRRDVLDQEKTSEEKTQARSTVCRPCDDYRIPQSTSNIWVLSFRHSTRLACVTTCLLMGRAVYVSIYEESRSDFWCEARVPIDVSAGIDHTVVGLRVPKECIPLFLDDNHPMHMRTTLNASDVRELCALIADRLILRRVAVENKHTPYRSWLDITGACGIGTKAATNHCDKGGSICAGQKWAFRLSLRKRAVGQVVFARLVSFWIRAGGRRKNRSRKGSARNDPDIGKVLTKIQMIVIVKELYHRGAVGELRAEVHDPQSSVCVQRFPVPLDVTSMLLAGRSAELTKNVGGEHDGAHLLTRYWRDALSWRLTLSIPATTETDIHSCPVTCEFIAADSATMHGIGSGSQVHLDRRNPAIETFSVAVRVAASSLGKNLGSQNAMRREAFDLILLPLWGGFEGRTAMDAVEFVLTHCQTITSFRFVVGLSAVISAVSRLALACLAAPASLSVELSSPASGLRELVESWLVYTPPGARYTSGRLTLTLTEAMPVHAYPYSGLGGTMSRATDFKLHHHSAPPPPSSDEVGDVAVLNTRISREKSSLSCNAVAEELEQAFGWTEQGMVSDVSRPPPLRTQRGSAADLVVKTRNERLIFLRKLPVPSFRESDNKQNPASLAFQEIIISVYEVFATGVDGRVKRSLTFCGRDETVRPAIEASTSVPWVGTCVGAEGGAVWRVATQGLRFQRMRDERGAVVGMKLDVSVPQRTGSSDYENITDSAYGEALNDVTPRDSVGLMSTDMVTQRPQSGATLGGAIAIGRRAHIASSIKGAEPPGFNSSKDNCRAESLKIYDGWHSITGVRLHVQCFQESRVGAPNVDDPAWRRPAARGGVFSLPRAASLQFLVCDPRNGRRSETQIPTDELYRNSSQHGGILEEHLLDAGRRPTLAREITKKLRLIFDASGGYYVTWPLPLAWVCA